MGVHQLTPPLEASSPTDANIRKRVCKACDRCRLKKSKCDGSNPCSRCKADNAICVFGERKKSHDKVYPKGYVEMLENQQSQLVTGLQELYKRTQNGQGWTGSPLKETSHGGPLTHDILERLGALKQEGHVSSEAFEEDLNLMQQRLIANGAGFMQREASSDTCSEIDQSPVFEQMPSKPPIFTDPFSHHQFPPTPPNESPHPRTAKTASPLRTQAFPQISNPGGMNWTPSNNAGFDDNMDFITKFDPSMSFTPMQMQLFQTQMLSNTINPRLSINNWAEDDDFQTFFNPTLI